MSRRLRALVAEDDPLQTLALQMILAEMGLEARLVARTGAEAIALAERHRPDLAILDVGLADGPSGLVVARHLSGALDIPVVVCSAHALGWTASTAGAAAFLRKPYVADDLIGAVSVVVASHEPPRRRMIVESAE